MNWPTRALRISVAIYSSQSSLDFRIANSELFIERLVWDGMSEETKIVFLGTGGGRFVTMTQRRRTAGIRILRKGLNLHLDPGPGALVHSINEGLDPQKLNAVFVSHCHPDHYTDAEVMVEAMTRGMTRKNGTLAAPKSVLKGNKTCEPSISKYHQRMTQQTIEAIPKTQFPLADINVSVGIARHTDPDAVGFKFRTEHADFAYSSDTEYFEGISKHYLNVKLLILCVMRPQGKPWKGHMTTDDAIDIIKETHPEQAVFTHLGIQMIFTGPEKQASIAQQKTGVPTVAATDGMQITLGETVTIQKPASRAQKNLSNFL